MSHLYRRVSLYSGLCVVVLWTLLRSIANGVNYDIVGQIGLAQQWAHGQMDGAQLGATNYLLKIPVYFVFNQFSAIPPLYRITLLAVLFNVATFYLLFKIYERIMKLYEIEDRRWFYIAFVWLATIAGNTFWVDYANSRNLETAGGMLFVYLVLKYVKLHKPSTLFWLIFVGSVVFFADPLQFYVCGVASCIFVFERLLNKLSQVNLIVATLISGSTLAAYVGAKLLTVLAKTIFHVTFLVVRPLHHNIDLPYVISVVTGLVTSTLTVFDANFLKGSHGPLLIRQLLNAALLSLVVALLYRRFVVKKSTDGYGLAITAIIVNYVVYVASGQVTQWQTARFLVMVPLFIVVMLSVSSGGSQNEAPRHKLQMAWIIALAASVVLLLGALAVKWPNRYANDAHITATVSFMKQNNFDYALASREVGITTTYFAEGSSTVLPMACQAGHTLQPTNLFYDNAAFKGLYSYTKEVPIIVGESGISFGGANCSQTDVIRQFGAPKRVLDIPGVGTAFIYNASSLRILGIDVLVGHSRQLSNSQLRVPTFAMRPEIRPLPEIPQLQGCSAGVIDVVVAHPDDDLLFMNPELAKQIAAKCVRTIFMTAGDDGRSDTYWLGRQHGIERAYAQMAGVPSDWSDTIVTINRQPVLTRQLAGRPGIILMFLRLPDGNVDGRGFAQTGSSSIDKISRIDSRISTVDKTAKYSYTELTNLVSDIIRLDNPQLIYTHLADGPLSVGDHSDHRAVGALTILAHVVAKSSAPVYMFVGYPSNGMPPNQSAVDTDTKSAIFSTYASEDGVICIHQSVCSIQGTYGYYFSRSYALTQDSQTTTVTQTKKSLPKSPSSRKHTPLELFQRNLE